MDKWNGNSRSLWCLVNSVLLSSGPGLGFMGPWGRHLTKVLASEAPMTRSCLGYWPCQLRSCPCPWAWETIVVDQATLLLYMCGLTTFTVRCRLDILLLILWLCCGYKVNCWCATFKPNPAFLWTLCRSFCCFFPPDFTGSLSWQNTLCHDKNPTLALGL